MAGADRLADDDLTGDELQPLVPAEDAGVAHAVVFVHGEAPRRHVGRHASYSTPQPAACQCPGTDTLYSPSDELREPRRVHDLRAPRQADGGDPGGRGRGVYGLPQRGLARGRGQGRREGGAADWLVRPLDAQGAVPARGQEDDGARAGRAARLDDARRPLISDGRRDRPRRHPQGLRGAAGDGLGRGSAAACDRRAGRGLRARGEGLPRRRRHDRGVGEPDDARGGAARALALRRAADAEDPARHGRRCRRGERARHPGRAAAARPSRGRVDVARGRGARGRPRRAQGAPRHLCRRARGAGAHGRRHQVRPADARAGLRVVDAAVVVVDAVAGVQVQTEKVWKFANEYELPRAIVVNRLDRERADFFRTLDSLTRRLKGRIVPLHLPVGEEAGFKGYVDLAKMKAFLYADGKSSETEVPADLAERAKEWREKLVEAAAETDDDLLTKYLEEGALDEASMLKALKSGIGAGKIVPVLCPGASRSIGSHPLLDLIVQEFPSPAEHGEINGTDVRAKQTAARPVDAKQPPVALVFKTLQDPHIGKLSLFRVMTGTVKADSTLSNPSRGARERMGHVAWLQGKTQKPVSDLGPGEIGVAQKLKETLTGDTLSDEAHAFELPRLTFPEPAINFAIQPKTRGDEDKISNALSRIEEEDPTVHHQFDPETKQLLISGVGSMHVERTDQRMKRKYNVDVTLLPPRIPYKETVKGRAEGQGKYKKQTGGRGQYGDTWLRVEPMTRGGGFEFVDDIFGGAVPRNFIRSAEKGVRECMRKGILAGYPIVDMKVTLYDGSYHDVDSSDMAFQIAASLGLQKVFMDAHPILLEPVMNVEVTTPAEVAGDIIGDLNSRRGRIVGMEPAGETAVVRAQAPMAEMLTYESSLRSMTGGRGGYSMEFSHYEEVPAFLADKVVKDVKAEKEKAEKH